MKPPGPTRRPADGAETDSSCNTVSLAIKSEGMKRKAKAMGATQSNYSTSGPNMSSDTKLSTGSSDEELFPVPLDILEEIFLNLPPDQVVHSCRLVCHEWKEVADRQSLWRERCRREGYHLPDTSKTPKDWRLFYFLCKKRRNLIKNPRGEHKMKYWQILQNGGDMWKIEGLMVPHPDETVQKNFVTSYGVCKKAQLIDLEKEGYNATFMDNIQPDIRISDWYAPRWDCGSEYNICVELLNKNKKPIQIFAPKTIYFEQWNDQQWNQMTHVFQNYGPGVRYIHFSHGGKDTQYWAGWYGIRVTNSCIEICPAADT
uniref:F-box protein 6, tandem duplicate 2 n=2 Tax=Lates calcarifer TaxID=8187 RepID=A0A4W6DL52_LATCA